MKYDIFLTFTIKVKEEADDNKVVETTTRNRAQKIEQKDLATKVTEFLSSVPEDATNLYLEVHKNWDSDMSENDF
jgi:hypothetical protein